MHPFKVKGLDSTDMEKCFPYDAILLGEVGSKSHGTYIPSSNPDSIDDIDILGVCIPPLDHYFGLKKMEQHSIMHQKSDVVWDVTTYEVRRFFDLLLKNNPNVLSFLWLTDTNYIYKNEFGKRLIENREIFSSKLAYKAFVGYANGQLHRMTHGEKRGIMGAKRKALVDKYSYDTKNAGHLIRLLRMGIEFLSTGELFVYRSDADELKDIKTGKWSLEKIQTESTKLFELARTALVNSKLPEKPDYHKAEELLMSIMNDWYEAQLWW